MAWPSSPFGGQSVTHVSGTFCYLCLGTVKGVRFAFRSSKQGIFASRSFGSRQNPCEYVRNFENSTVVDRIDAPLHSVIQDGLKQFLHCPPHIVNALYRYAHALFPNPLHVVS